MPLLLLVLGILAPPSMAQEPWIAGYYVGYQSDIYPPDKVDFDHLTHIMVGRVTPNPDGSLKTHLDLDSKRGPDLAKDLARRARAKGKKAILFIGGAGEQQGWRGATRQSNLDKFVNNLISIVDDWAYHGLDLDWEPLESQDESAFLALVAALRQKRPNLFISFPIGWINPNTEKISPIYKQLLPYIDQFNIMSYGMANAWFRWHSWHSSALYGEDAKSPSSVASSVKAYLEAGIPRHKLGIGAGFYGSCWTGGVTAPRQMPWVSRVVASDNELSYTAITEKYYALENYHFDSSAGAPYLSSRQGLGPRHCTFLSYEDETSLKLKGDFIKKQGLGGAIIWTINQGYLSHAHNKNPLLSKLYQATR